VVRGGVTFLIWGSVRYRSLTYCPFDKPIVGHPYGAAAVIAASAALIVIVLERAVARRRWLVVLCIGVLVLALSCIAIYIAAIMVGGAHYCFD
jgi:hypothetical protein